MAESLRTHRAWRRSGRTLDILETGQRIYTAAMGQVNVEVTPDTFTPYVWDSQQSIVYIANAELRFVGDGWEYWIAGEETRRMKAAAHPEWWDGGTWVRQMAQASALTVEEVATTGPRDFLDITYTINTRDQEATITLRLGGSHKIILDTQVRAKSPGQHRIVYDVDVDEDMVPRTRRNHASEAQTPTQYANSRFRWAWKPAELSGRLVTRTASRFRPHLLEGTYARDEIRRARPDTLGPTGIAADADDGDEDEDAPSYYSNGRYATGFLYVEAGTGSDVERACWRFDNIDLETDDPGVDSIDAGTQLDLSNDDNDNSGPQNIEPVTFSGENGADPAQWADSGGNRPSDRTLTTANYTMSTSGRTADFTQPATDIVTELVLTDGNPYTGTQAMAFQAVSGDNTGGEWWSLAEDYDGAGALEETTLTIVYTPTSAGGRTTYNTRSWPLGTSLGMGFRMALALYLSIIGRRFWHRSHKG